MKPRKSPSDSQKDLFRLQLSNMIDMRHELVKLAELIDWQAIDQHLNTYIHSTRGNSALPTRLIAGLLYLQHAFGLSDEALCGYWVENPYWQYFCGEVYFQHELPCHPTSLTKWRKRLGKEGCEALLAQTIACAKTSGALTNKQCREIIVDTTVQEKNIAHPTDTRLLEKAREKMVFLAKKHGIDLRQNYNRICRELVWKVGGYGRAEQYKRLRNVASKHKSRVGRVYRDITRKLVDASQETQQAFAEILAQTDRLLKQSRTSKNKLYSLHAPEVECISKGKLRKKYEFGVKASFAITQDGNWVMGGLHCPGNPYDGHTLKSQVEQTERLTGVKVRICRVDKGYRGKDSQVAGVKIIHNGLSRKCMSRRQIKKLKRRNAIEPVIGHMKSDGKLRVNYLKGQLGDAINIILSAAGQNIRKLLHWLRIFFAYISYQLSQVFLLSQQRNQIPL